MVIFLADFPTFQKFGTWFALQLITLSSILFLVIRLKTTVMKFLSIITLIAIVATTNNLSAQSCTITCPPNITVKADSAKEGAIVNFAAATTSGDCGLLTYSRESGSFFRIGSHTVTVSSSFGPKCSFTITVTDNESPVLSPLTLSSKKIWPPSNKMKKVGVYYTTKDNAEEVNSILTVSSNATDGRDWEVVNNHLLRLKASRLPNGEPRIYIIKVSSSDVAGNTTTRTTSIVVSKTMVAQEVVVAN